MKIFLISVLSTLLFTALLVESAYAEKHYTCTINTLASHAPEQAYTVQLTDTSTGQFVPGGVGDGWFFMSMNTPGMKETVSFLTAAYLTNRQVRVRFLDDMSQYSILGVTILGKP